MADLDTLRPEVQKALHGLRKCVLRCEPSLDVGLAIIRAELLLLAEDAAMLAHAVSLGQRYKQRAEHAEAELAAVKSATCDWRHDLDEDTWDSACGERWMFDDGGPEENSVRFCHGCGKRVRLVVEE